MMRVRLFAYPRAVRRSFLGLRRRAAAKEDTAALHPLRLLATGVVFAAGCLALLTSMAGPARAAGSAPPPRVPDTLAQRVLACTGCHGQQGRASNEGYVPRIAGKPAAYLQRQLLSFRDGRRRHEGMARLLEGLPDTYLQEIATHFATLDLPPEKPPSRPMSAAAVQRAAQLVREGDRASNIPSCVACHGERLGGQLPGVPGLAGLPRDYTVAQLGAWRIGLRQASVPDCMSTIARSLQPADITAIADWLAAQPAAAPSRGATAPSPVACGGMTSP